MKRNDLLPVVTATLANEDGSVDDFTAATVRFTLRLPGAATAKVDAAAAFTNIATGAVQYVWAAGDTDTPGNYLAEWEVTFANGKLKTFPTSGYDPLVIDDDLDTAATATTNLLTLAEGRLAVGLNADDTSHDANLPTLIAGVSRRLDQLCGPVVIRTVSAEAHDGGAVFVELDYPPVSAVTAVTEYDGTTATALTAETNVSKPASAYHARLRSGLLYRRSGGYTTTFADGMGNVVVTYQSGRYATTAAVDELFKTAARIMLAAVWRREVGTGGQLMDGATFDVPFAVYNPQTGQGLLADEVRPSVA